MKDYSYYNGSDLKCVSKKDFTTYNVYSGGSVIASGIPAVEFDRTQYLDMIIEPCVDKIAHEEARREYIAELKLRHEQFWMDLQIENRIHSYDVHVILRKKTEYLANEYSDRNDLCDKVDIYETLVETLTEVQNAQ